MNNDINSEASVAAIPHLFCKACASPLIQATDWQQDIVFRWHVRLWCPECGFEREVLLEQHETARLSRAIEAGFAYLLEALFELEALAETDAADLDLIRRVRHERIGPSAS